MFNKDSNKEHHAMLKSIFEERHGKVWVHSDICKRWKETHSKCTGCIHKKRCNMYVLWMMSIADGIDPAKYLDDPTKYTPGGPGGFIQ